MAKKVRINEQFFDKWTPEMAWVLGLFFTDGHFGVENSKGVRRVYLAQKEPELLEKVKFLMGSDHKIVKNTQTNKIDSIYYFSFTNDKLFKALIDLGLTHKKSLIIKFPKDISPDCLRHFLRGCWDGDGSFYYENKDGNKIRGDFVSGSYDFIFEYVEKLKSLLELDINIYKKHKNETSYYIKLAPRQTIKLFKLFYDDVPESTYLSKKYSKLKFSYELLKA